MGALTAKATAFQARPWDITNVTTINVDDSLDTLLTLTL